MRPAEKSKSHGGFSGRKIGSFTKYSGDVFGALNILILRPRVHYIQKLPKKKTPV